MSYNVTYIVLPNYTGAFVGPMSTFSTMQQRVDCPSNPDVRSYDASSLLCYFRRLFHLVRVIIIQRQDYPNVE